MRPDKFRTTRKKLGLTQKQLAEHFRVDQSQISRWENGRAAVPKRAPRILRSLDSRKAQVVVRLRLADSGERIEEVLDAGGWQPVPNIPAENVECAVVMVAGRPSAIRSWIHGQNVRRGQKRARRRGRKIGRPRKRFDLTVARKMREAGLKWGDIAVLVDVSESTLRRRLRADSESSRNKVNVWRF